MPGEGRAEAAVTLPELSILMKYIKQLPFDCVLDDARLDCGLWSSDRNACEMKNDDAEGQCDDSGLYYGTCDSHAPKFCARHFYQSAVAGDGKGNYMLVSREHEEGAQP